MIPADCRTVLSIDARASDVYGSDCERLRAIRSRLLDRLDTEAAKFSATVTVADQSWAYDRFAKAIIDLVDWIDAKISACEYEHHRVSGPDCW